MVLKLQMPNGGGVVVLAEDINAIEIGPTPTDGTQPVTTIFMRGGATHPILRGDGEQVMALMGALHPASAALLPSAPNTSPAPAAIAAR
jgi:hypothetical protein